MMTDSRKAAVEFFNRYGMDPSSIDISKECERFIGDMKAGLEGGQSTVRMIPTYVCAGRDIPVGEPVIAIDAGGTNFRVGVVTFDAQRKPEVSDYSAFPMPGSQSRISRDEFFSKVAEYLLPVIGKADKIGFCFSYPTEILPNGDGRLIRFCKEVEVDGVEGTLVGEGLLEALAVRGVKGKKSILLLNDTVATLLGGQAARANRKYGSYIGFILGTGTNTCYIERNAAIRKCKGIEPEGSMVINIESGAYGAAPRGRIDEAFDAQTTNPGEHTFEKMISGAYFGELAQWVLQKAAEDQLFSGECARKIAEVHDFATKDANDFLDDPHGGNLLASCCAADADRTMTCHLLDLLFERCAKLVAMNLSAVVVKSGEGSDPARPVCIAAEGTMFHKSKTLRTKLDFYMKSYLQDELGLYHEFVEAENSTLLGTAIAGLTAKI